jgi:hypothetical protein
MKAVQMIEQLPIGEWDFGWHPVMITQFPFLVLRKRRPLCAKD